MSESAGRRPRRLRLLVVCPPLSFLRRRRAVWPPLTRSAPTAVQVLGSHLRPETSAHAAQRVELAGKKTTKHGKNRCASVSFARMHACTGTCTCTRTHTRTQCTCDERWPGVLSQGNECVRRGSIPAASCFLCAAPWPLAASLEDAAGFSLAQQMACAHARVRACASVSAHICFSGQL